MGRLALKSSSKFFSSANQRPFEKKSHFGAKRSADDISVLPYWYLIGKHEKEHYISRLKSSQLDFSFQSSELFEISR